MPNDHQRFFVLTGGPGSGKSTLIAALGDAGFAGSTEAGRAIIKDQVLIGGPALPWENPALFSEMMLSWEMRSYGIAARNEGNHFFDRGVPDIIGYMRLSGLEVPAHVQTAARRCLYNRKVFLLPPWPEIFAQDSERKQTLEEAKRTFDAVAQAYADCDYELIEVPRADIEERRRFVLETAGLA
ncbi:AAA family ATPase [Mesorhizobium sp. 1B3]|uniref:AAA family ATPase n=1 Tax=Mesorhizobium sp. 1B3 TaxID=3243599 RepID=UPI003D97BFE3